MGISRDLCGVIPQAGTSTARLQMPPLSGAVCADMNVKQGPELRVPDCVLHDPRELAAPSSVRNPGELMWSSTVAAILPSSRRPRELHHVCFTPP